MFERIMYIRTVVRALLFWVTREYGWKQSFEKSVEITQCEINWVKYCESKKAK